MMNDSDLLPCGAIHPSYPEVTCIRLGKCPIDWHLGKVRIGKSVELVEFGSAAEESATIFGWHGYRLLKRKANVKP